MSDKCVPILPTNEIDKLLCEYITDLRFGYVEIGEEKVVLPVKYVDIADDIENFEVFESDIYVMSHPKTGTTWTQEMVWMIYNLDYERAKVSLKLRFPFLEYTCIHDFQKILEDNPEIFPPNFSLDSVNFTKSIEQSPRFIKTHLPWSLLPKDIRENGVKPKIIYVVRNPKDTCVSYYHHVRLIEGYSGTFENFCKLFLAGRVNYGPFWKNVLGFWERRNEPNILFIRYEDMKNDLSSVIMKVADFLEKTLTKEDITKMVDHLSFESMKKNENVNNDGGVSMMRRIFTNQLTSKSFLRSGTVGSYKADMTPEIIKMFDEWTAENTKGSGLSFGLE